MSKALSYYLIKFPSLSDPLFFLKITLVILHIYFLTYILESACQSSMKNSPVGILSGTAPRGEITSLGYHLFPPVSMVYVCI